MTLQYQINLYAWLLFFVFVFDNVCIAIVVRDWKGRVIKVAGRTNSIINNFPVLSLALACRGSGSLALSPVARVLVVSWDR